MESSGTIDSPDPERASTERRSARNVRQVQARLVEEARRARRQLAGSQRALRGQLRRI